MSVYNITHKPKRYNCTNEYLFVFNNFESLITGILFLYRTKLNIASTVYKTFDEYRLIVSSNNFKPYFLILGEYCTRKSTNIFEVEFTKEHGMLICEKSAVKTLGKCFFKEF